MSKLIQTDINQFKLAMANGKPFTKAYSALDGNLEVVYRTPKVRDVDISLEHLALRERQGAPKGILERESRRLRLLSYIDRLYYNGASYTYEELSERLAKSSIEVLMHSFDLFDEAVYNILDAFAEDFKMVVTALAGAKAAEESALVDLVRRTKKRLALEDE